MICPDCYSHVQESSSHCPQCGVVRLTDNGFGKRYGNMSEAVYFKGGGIVVTKYEIITEDFRKICASEISSTSIDVLRANRRSQIAAFIVSVGAFVFGGSFGVNLAGATLALACAAWATSSRDGYYVKISAATGDLVTDRLGNMSMVADVLGAVNACVERCRRGKLLIFPK